MQQEKTHRKHKNERNIKLQILPEEEEEEEEGEAAEEQEGARKLLGWHLEMKGDEEESKLSPASIVKSHSS